MTALTEVFVTVKPDTEKFGPEVSKKLARIDSAKSGKQFATRFGVGMNGAIGGIVSKSAGLFAAGFAAVQGVKVFGGFINDARESEKISRITANAIKATGGAAKISADQVGALATSISNKTAIDDEQVQTAANMLLTFKNIRNEAGKGNDVFNQATQAAADLSVQFGGIDGASKQLGKALNDPIKGTTALAKAGVTFTDQQKKQIETLVKSGDTLGAQKIILKEIEGQVGGAAAAAADPVEKLKVVAGNLAEEVGGFLLPAVNKFSKFATGTLIPGVQGLFAAFQGEGVTSDGFVGFMERVGVVARQVFDFFKAEVLPRLKEFGGFIIGTVVPALVALGTRLVTELGPAVKDVFGFFKTEVIPRLQEFAGFLGDKVLPPIQKFADKVLLSKDFLVPFAGIILGVVGALKAWSIAQGILNTVLAANPIGIIVVAIAGLVAGLIYAYKNSEKFRDVVNGVWKAVSGAATTAFKAVVGAVKTAIDWVTTTFPKILAVITFPFTEGQRLIGLAWEAIKTAARAGIKFVVDKFLGLVQTMLEGAAKAFGWVPGLGDKLKGAASAFGTFRDDVNRKLSGIEDQTVNVTPHLKNVTYTVAGVTRTTDVNVIGSAGRGMADGGGVFGGTRGKDSVPALLMPDEHVWTTKEVSAVGGHGAMKRIRQAALAGELNGFAGGGGVNARGVFPSDRGKRVWANDIAAGAVRAAKPLALQAAAQVAKSLLAAGGDSGPPGSRKSFRGVTLNQRTIRMLLNAERFLGAMFHITQGSYSTRVAASGSTHAGGGAMDTNGPRGWNVAVAALRKAGFAAWHRTPSQGPWRDHIHAIALGDPTASRAAKNQMAAYRRGGDGLGHGMSAGGKVGSYADGAWRIFRDQLAMVHKDEMVVPAKTAGFLRELLPALSLHQLHEKHQAHTAHVAHVAHWNNISGRGRLLARARNTNDALSPARLHPDDIRALARELGGVIQANPPRVHLDGRRLDEGMTRRALNGGF